MMNNWGFKSRGTAEAFKAAQAKRQRQSTKARQRAVLQASSTHASIVPVTTIASLQHGLHACRHCPSCKHCACSHHSTPTAWIAGVQALPQPQLITAAKAVPGLQDSFKQQQCHRMTHQLGSAGACPCRIQQHACRVSSRRPGLAQGPPCAPTALQPPWPACPRPLPGLCLPGSFPQLSARQGGCL